MNLDGVAKTLAASAAALLIAGCGGGGGDAAPAAGNVVLSGTAAVGAALADASVEVKCAEGSGSTTTTTAGGYTVTVSGGKLPCIVKVSGTGNNGVAVTLHSVAESGTAAGDDVNATANVTPVTEMIVAQLMAALPSEVFANFNPQQVTQAALDSAADAIVAALKTAGIDLSAIDPLKDPLVPANGSTAGNAYDVLLDKLGEKVGPEALPLVVNQIANAATTKSSEGLSTAIAAVAGGTLEGCPVAVSGKYRVIDFRGAMQVVDIDFSKMKVIAGDAEVALTAATDQACEVSAADGNGTVVAFGASGVGLLRDNYTTGILFPVQSLTHADIAGEWTFVEGGQDEYDHMVKFLGKVDFKADRSVGLCEYDLEGGVTSTCSPDTESGDVADGTDGGLVLNYGEFPARFYGYRTPGGTLTLFGTNNPDGNTGAVMKSHFIAYKGGQTVALPPLNQVRKTWGAVARPTSTPGTLLTMFTRDTQTITAVDEAAGTYTRVYEGSSLEDIFSVNKPLTGMIHRQNRSNIYGMPVPGTGLTVAVNAPGNTNYVWSTTLGGRP